MIALEHVGMAFGGRRVLDDVCFTFEPGEPYVLQAPSGAGKSTVLNIAAGYVTPTSGRVLAGGPVEYLMQDELLFSELTVGQNLRARSLGLRPGRAGARDSQVSVHDALARLGLAGREDDRVSFMSGGERRRVELAGTLLSDPRVLLLDEPVAHLDPDSARDVYDALWSLRAGRTIVVVTHERDLSTIRGGFRRLTIKNARFEEP
ncbi:ABC transporter ATP-binding protein [Oerskovia turbata]|uniref:ABC transporter ATP-binding protein n=1 Tax=Oerskovia turbata TaxID=1713 RepID=A0A4Q1KV08_9CELL|nr:ABC transporter ATP-binding protein [Oerskovia turbata]RXR25387.1 ABC transporter ATP-binding protein [Oerskovia turbata]RXR33972.1 ABC transporter ATP-binding protein [Oerskovia turbata]TGJ95654.1 ABC transporter ATP-binding protein [Actinotalea fermentans ATCC 43279 = JCM 9966 = DSM 3133]